MIAERIAGMTAVISGALLTVGLIAAALIGPSYADADTMAAVMATHMGAGMTNMMTGSMGMGMNGMMGAGVHPAATAIPNAKDVRVEITNFAFTPSEIRMPKGADVNLILHNGTGVLHDFNALALHLHVNIAPGDTAVVGLRDLQAGRYEAYCSVDGHADLGMRATVVVE